MPWFSQEALATALHAAGIDYVHLPELGGRRGPRPGSPNEGWRVRGFQGYADHMESAEFAAGIERLLEVTRSRRTAVMCAEAAWWRCHRRLLSDALVARGWSVIHLDARGAGRRHELTEFAVVEDEGVRYPPGQAALDV